MVKPFAKVSKSIISVYTSLFVLVNSGLSLGNSDFSVLYWMVSSNFLDGWMWGHLF